MADTDPKKNRAWLATATAAVSLVALVVYISIGGAWGINRDHYSRAMGVSGDVHHLRTDVMLLVGFITHALICLVAWWYVHNGKTTTNVRDSMHNELFWVVTGVADALVAIAVATNSGTRETGLLFLIAVVVLCGGLYTAGAAHYTTASLKNSFWVYRFAIHVPTFVVTAAPWIVVAVNAFQYNHDWNDVRGVGGADSDGVAWTHSERDSILASTSVAAFGMIARSILSAGGFLPTKEATVPYSHISQDDSSAGAKSGTRAEKLGMERLALGAWVAAVIVSILAISTRSEFENWLPSCWYIGDHRAPAITCGAFNAVALLLVASAIGILYSTVHALHQLAEWRVVTAGITMLNTRGDNIWRSVAESATGALVYATVVASVGTNDVMEIFLGSAVFVAGNLLIAIIPALDTVGLNTQFFSYVLTWLAVTAGPFVGPLIKLTTLADSDVVEQGGNGRGILEESQVSSRIIIFAAMWASHVLVTAGAFVQKKTDSKRHRVESDAVRYAASSICHAGIIISLCMFRILDSKVQSEAMCAFDSCVRANGGNPASCYPN